MMTCFSPLRGALYLSTAWFAGMTAAALAFCYLYHIVTKNQIYLLVKRHRYGHICKDILYDRHVLFVGARNIFNSRAFVKSDEILH